MRPSALARRRRDTACASGLPDERARGPPSRSGRPLRTRGRRGDHLRGVIVLAAQGDPRAGRGSDAVQSCRRLVFRTPRGRAEAPRGARAPPRVSGSAALARWSPAAAPAGGAEARAGRRRVRPARSPPGLRVQSCRHRGEYPMGVLQGCSHGQSRVRASQRDQRRSNGVGLHVSVRPTPPPAERLPPGRGMVRR